MVVKKLATKHLDPLSMRLSEKPVKKKSLVIILETDCSVRGFSDKQGLFGRYPKLNCYLLQLFLRFDTL